MGQIEIYKVSVDNYVAEGIKRYGPDNRDWTFQCPVCKVKTKWQEWLDIDPEAKGQIGFSCIGRLKGTTQGLFTPTNKMQPIGCNYTCGGLFNLSNILLIKDGKTQPMFNFADDPISCDLLDEVPVSAE